MHFYAGKFGNFLVMLGIMVNLELWWGGGGVNVLYYTCTRIQYFNTHTNAECSHNNFVLPVT